MGAYMAKKEVNSWNGSKLVADIYNMLKILEHSEPLMFERMKKDLKKILDQNRKDILIKPVLH